MSDRFASPHAYTPKHLAEKILTSRSALEGERKQVTVLFADLKDSMELLAARDPEEARKILDPVLERMIDAVHRYEGTINQVMGDGIMALFGAPLGHEDHAVRACYAALQMQQAIRRYAQSPDQAETPIGIRIGLNSGEVVVRSIGSDLHMDYTAVGQTTHLAARMEQAASPGSTLITAATLRLVEEFVVAERRGRVPVKGLTEPVLAYELVGAVATRTRLQSMAGRGLTPFVGRGAELEELRRALAAAIAGHGQLVAVIGEPGVGKSRLVFEFAGAAEARRLLMLETRGTSYAKAIPYLPVVELLREYFQIEERDSPGKISEKVTGMLADSTERLSEEASPFLALLDAPVDDPEWHALDPPQRRLRTLDACRRLVVRESRIQPLLLVIENLHWIDSETQALVDALVESLPTARILMVVTYRPEYQHPWGHKTYYRQLSLNVLVADRAEALLHSVLGDDPSLRPLGHVLTRRTAGNPLFLEEYARSLVETGVLAGERGAYRLVGNAEDIPVPPTLQAILAARIDRLGPDDKWLLEAASVVGKDVPFSILRAIVDTSEEELRRGLARLQHAEFLYEARLFPDLEYTFKHALTYEVAYGTLVHERRRALHDRALDAIEGRYPDRLGEQAEALAQHAARAGRWRKAVRYLRLAAEKARGRSAHRQAITYLDHALVALARLPSCRETQAEGVDLRLDLRVSLYALGEMERTIAVLREAEAISRALDDRQRLAWSSAFLGESFRLVGDLRDAHRYLECAKNLADSLEEAHLKWTARHYCGIAWHASGDYRRAVGFFEGAATLDVPEIGSASLSGSQVGWQAGNLSWLARALAQLGAFVDGLAAGRQSLELAERLNHPYSLVLACLGLGEVYRLRGDMERAIPLLERSAATARQWAIAVMTPQVMSRLGSSQAYAGRMAEGVGMLREAVATLQSAHAQTRYAEAVMLLGDALVLAGDVDAARPCAERAVALARQQGQRGVEAAASHLVGVIRSRSEPSEAEDTLRYALALSTELGMRPLMAHCHASLARLCRRTDKRSQAQEHFVTAATLYREMDMRLWLDRAGAG